MFHNVQETLIVCNFGFAFWFPRTNLIFTIKTFIVALDKSHVTSIDDILKTSNFINGTQLIYK